MKITFVKKTLLNGSPCQKCASMIYKLEASGHIDKITNIITAKEGDSNSEGFILANKYQINEAPFFIVEHDNCNIEIVSTYNDFLRVVLATENQ